MLKSSCMVESTLPFRVCLFEPRLVKVSFVDLSNVETLVT